MRSLFFAHSFLRSRRSSYEVDFQPIELVGSKIVRLASGATSVSLTGLTGGFGTRPEAGDTVIVAVGYCGNGPQTAVTDYAERVDTWGGSFDPAALQVSTKKLATEETTLTVPSVAANRIVAIEVWRCVEDIVIDSAPAQAAGQAASVDPPSVTPVTEGSKLTVVGMRAVDGAITPFTATGLDGFIQLSYVDAGANDNLRLGIGHLTWSGTGAVNPVAWTDGSGNGWAAGTIALRPGTTPGAVPSFVGDPAISGTAEEHQTLTVSYSETGGGIPTYQWKRNGTNIGGATASTYQLVSADVGTNVSCEVVLTSPYGSDTGSATAVGPVADGPDYPATVSDVVAIFDADTLALADGANVNTWDAELGTAQAVGGTNKPILKTSIINGRDIVRAATNQSMTLPTNLLSGTNGTDGATLIYLGKSSPTIGTGGLFGDFGTDGNQNHYPYSDNTIYEDFCTTARKTCGSFNTQLQAWHIGVLRSKTNLWDLRLAGVSRFNTATNTFGANTAPKLFTSGSFWNGDLAWWALFDRYLSDAEVAAWEAFLVDPAMFNELNPPVATRYHRFRATGNFSGSGWKAILAREVEFRSTVGGAKLVGTLTGSNVQSGLVGENANDGNSATYYQGGTGFGTATETLTLDLGVGNTAVVREFGFSPHGTSGDGLVYSPTGFVMETSPDGSTWTTNWTQSGISTGGWTDSVLRLFAR